MEPRTLWSVSVTLRTTLPALDGEGAYAVPGASQPGCPASLRISLLRPRAALLATSPLSGAADEARDGSSLPGGLCLWTTEAEGTAEVSKVRP